MSFQEIFAQPAPVRILQSAIEKDRVAHAYLFVGPSGVGRKLTANVFAKSLNCEKFRDHNPCGTCASCRLIAEGTHPDVQTISPIKRSSTITVEQIENLLPFAHMRPIKGRCKVFIISEADRLRLETANKLLKTLEEPPPSTVFVLVTEKPENMLPTVTSRCQPVKFGRLGKELIARILVSDFGIEEKRAAVAAELAGGQITKALEFADPVRSEAILGIIESLQPFPKRMDACDALLVFLTERRQKLAEEADEKISNFGEDLNSAIKTANEDLRKSFIDKHYREILNDCFGLLLTFYRDVFVLKETNAEELVINRNRMHLLQKQAKQLSPEAIIQNMADIEKASEYCSHYVGEDRVFLDLLLKLRN